VFLSLDRARNMQVSSSSTSKEALSGLKEEAPGLIGA